jgi:rubrerythrin
MLAAVKEFNIHRFLDLAGGVRIDDLDWKLCREIGLSDEEARILRYMADTESHTLLYMRDLLAGHSTRDPEIMQFLSVWVYEELCHGRAIDRLLRESGYPAQEERMADVAKGSALHEVVEAVISHAVAWTTPRFIAVHMTWGAINEATAAAAYQSVEQRTANPVLKTLVSRMARQERRHMSFYWHQAKKRMDGDPMTQRLVRFAIKRFWTLVGSGVGGRENLEYVAAHLFADEPSRKGLDYADDLISQLPGMEWFDGVTRQTIERAESYERVHGKGVYRTNSHRVPAGQNVA